METSTQLLGLSIDLEELATEYSRIQRELNSLKETLESFKEVLSYAAKDGDVIAGGYLITCSPYLEIKWVGV